MKKLLLKIAGIVTIFLSGSANAQDKPLFYDISFERFSGGDPIKLSNYEGKVILIVNIATKCGFTPQLKDLQSLYETYEKLGLIIIGVPSDDFGGQSPGSGEEIAKFCEKNYGVSFPVTAKYHVTGDESHDFYKRAYQALGFGTGPKWNFHKYIINRHGQLTDYFYSNTSPASEKFTTALERLLAEK